MARPHKYDSVEDFRAAVAEYRAKCDSLEEPATITGLVLHLGFATKQSLYDQAKRGPDWEEAVNFGRTLVEHSYEKKGAMGAMPPAMAIFALKNFDWRDKQEIEHSGKVDLASTILAARNRTAADEDQD